MHARERRHGLAAALAATKAQRTQLIAQHRRFVTTLATKLGPLPARRGRGIVLGESVDDFIDIINGVALHGVDEATARTMLANNPDVASIEPIREVHATLTVSVPLIEADKVWAVADVNGIGIDGAGMRIGILDTGVDYTHPDLGGCLGAGCKVAAGYDFVNHDADPMDNHGHGTHVAARGRRRKLHRREWSRAIRGVAPGAEIYAYKVLSASGSGFDDDISRPSNAARIRTATAIPPITSTSAAGALAAAAIPTTRCPPRSKRHRRRRRVLDRCRQLRSGRVDDKFAQYRAAGHHRRGRLQAELDRRRSGLQLPIADFSSRGPVVWGYLFHVMSLRVERISYARKKSLDIRKTVCVVYSTD